MEVSGARYKRLYTKGCVQAFLITRFEMLQVPRAVIIPNRWLHFRFGEDCIRVLVVCAALAAMAGARDAHAGVLALALDGCSGSCNPNTKDEPAIAQDWVEDKVTLSLCGGDPTAGALLFDPEAVPTALANGVPSALLPDRRMNSGVQLGSAYVDFEYVFTHPDAVGAPTLFMSVASLAGQSTLGDFLSDSNAYFAAQSQALFSGGSQSGLELGVMRTPGLPPSDRFSTGDSEASPKKATRPAPSMGLPLPLSQ